MQIKQLKIYSANIAEQTKFYNETLGLEILHQTKKEVTFQVGKSILKIEYQEKSTPYHFAINIPSNKAKEALQWLKRKVEILKDGNIEIQDFDFWNAEAIYFYDKDYNIVELIARKNLKHPSTQLFNIHQFLEISEIGVPTSNIEKAYHQLKELTNIEIFDGGFERFCAVGDEHGLFICINKNIKDWFPTNDKAFSSAFEINFIEKDAECNVEFKDEQINKLAYFS